MTVSAQSLIARAVGVDGTKYENVSFSFLDKNTVQVSVHYKIPLKLLDDLISDAVAEE